MLSADRTPSHSHRHILFVFSGPPCHGTGSQIVVDRHLRRLAADGWKISILAPENTLIGENFADRWQVIPLPMRRWWWTPFRPEIPGLLALRLFCWQWECERYLGKERPTAILTVLWSVYALLAAHLSKSWNIPLSVMIHDQQELWAKSEPEQRAIAGISRATLQQAARIWPVSQELGNVYGMGESSQTRVLLPICEGYSPWVEWQDRFQTNPVVAHAGSLHPFQISNLQEIALALAEVNGTLLLLTRADNPVLLHLLANCPNVKYQEPFAKNEDAISFLAENASCILVSYSFDFTEQPWAATSFPSKLVEFSHLGLPIILLAPPNTPSANWAKKYQWLGYIDSLDRLKLVYLLNKIKQPQTWWQMAEQSRQVALNEFNPDLIHSQFASELAVKIN